jgi:hypothetical protein
LRRVNLTLPAAGRIDLSRWLPSSGQTPTTTMQFLEHQGRV